MSDRTSAREVALEAEVAALRQRVAQLETGRCAHGASPEVARLQHERAVLRQILEISPVGMLIIDGSRRFIFTNARARDILGLTGDDMAALGAFDDFWHLRLEDGTLMTEATSPFGRVLASREPVRDIRFSVEFGGRRMLLSADGVPLFDDEGRLDGVLCSFEDVTERRLAEEALRRAHSALQQHLTNTPLAAVELDRDFRVTAFSRRAEELFGFTADEMIGKHPTEVRWVPSAAWPEVERRMRQVREGSAEIVGYNPNYRKDGSVVHCEWYISSLYDEQGALQSVLALGNDVTARIDAERALERQMARYRTVVELALDGIHLLDEDGYLVEANSAFYESLGLTPEEARGMHLTEWNCHHSASELMERVRGCLEHPARLETKHRRKDGTQFDVEVSAGAVDIEGRRFLVAIARDVTARKTLERRRRRTVHVLKRRVAEEVERALASEQAMIHQARLASLGEMLGRIAHQWRQPLNVLNLLMANLRDARACGELDDGELDRFLEQAGRQVQQMSTTISDFIEFFRPDKEAVAFDVVQRVVDAVALVEPSMRHHGVEVSVSGPPGILTVGYPNEYAQVVLNLLTNARDAIVGTGRADGRVRISVQATDGQCELSVADNGGGVPDAVADHIFEPYFTTRVSGTGLGLYMSRSIVTLMGGKLGLRNEGPGAVFTITTPLATEA